MIEITVSGRILELAKRKAALLPKLRNSIHNGEGNLVGYIGQYMVKEFLGPEAEMVDGYNYDIRTGLFTIDVKSKECTSKPKPHHEASVACYNLKQNCDYYIFTRVLNDHSKIWIVGYYESDEYMQDAKQLRKGEVDPSNGFVCRADCLNMPISQLKELHGITALRSASKV